MRALLARVLMAVVGRCMGQARSPWSLAMQAEFEEARADGAELAFAIGCLVAALGELPRSEEGRTALRLYALALGLIVPVAAFQLSLGLGLPGSAGIADALGSGRATNPYLIGAQLAAVPSLLMIRLILAAGHLRLAWVLLERDWGGVLRAGGLIASTGGTMLLYTGMLFLADPRLASQAALLAIELFALTGLALHASASSKTPSRTTTQS